VGFNAIHSHTHKNENGARKKESCELRLEEEEKGRFIMLERSYHLYFILSCVQK
jgi:hypothetical protein